MRVKDETAIAIICALREAGPDGLDASTFRRTVDDLGGRSDWIGPAVKMLRDYGVPIVVVKARQYTRWSIKNGDDAWNEWTKRVLKEAYSEFLSTFRALTRPTAQSAVVQDIAPAVASIQGAVMVMGTQLHRSMDEIKEDMEHRSVPPEVAAEIATIIY